MGSSTFLDSSPFFLHSRSVDGSEWVDYKLEFTGLLHSQAPILSCLISRHNNNTIDISVPCEKPPPHECRLGSMTQTSHQGPHRDHVSKSSKPTQPQPPKTEFSESSAVFHSPSFPMSQKCKLKKWPMIPNSIHTVGPT